MVEERTNCYKLSWLLYPIIAHTSGNTCITTCTYKINKWRVVPIYNCMKGSPETKAWNSFWQREVTQSSLKKSCDLNTKDLEINDKEVTKDRNNSASITTFTVYLFFTYHNKKKIKIIKSQHGLTLKCLFFFFKLPSLGLLGGDWIRRALIPVGDPTALLRGVSPPVGSRSLGRLLKRSLLLVLIICLLLCFLATIK